MYIIKMNIMKPINNIILIFILFLAVAGLPGCNDEWLTENPRDELSSSSFWKNENDALLALTGIYDAARGTPNNDVIGFQRPFSWMTDEGRNKMGLGTWVSGELFTTSDAQVRINGWQRPYQAIFRSNFFLDNIDKVEGMDPVLKAQYIAEARFLRAEQYFWLSFRFGNVPMPTNVLSVEEANSIMQTPKDQVVEFTLNELTAAAADLPATRPESERGRILKGAALAYKGRLLLIEKRWAEAAAAYKEIIDSDAHIIDPRFQDIFTVRGNNSKEIIFQYVCLQGQGTYANYFYQRNFCPHFFGGFEEGAIYQELIDEFLMNDGLPIDESPLYDPENPFDNRDPRLYASVFLPDYTVFRGITFQGHPDSTQHGIRTRIGSTGYVVKKFVDELYTGDDPLTGADYIMIRYAEVLLGYLEAMLESGATITQQLLDLTINQIRSRAAVGMPPVTETDQGKLREIVRRERRIELFYEPYIRHMDLHRWGLWPEIMETSFHGMKLTDDPGNYKTYPVDANGHLISWNRKGHFRPANRLIPIPQVEIDINPNLVQNPGY